MANQVKRKKVRKTAKQIEFGGEPHIQGLASELELTRAFNWYNLQFDHTQAKKWVLEYLKKNKRSVTLINQIKAAPDYRTITTAGWMARMMLNGAEFDHKYMERFEERLRLNALYGVKDEIKEEKSTVSIQDRVRRSISNTMADAEVYIIDDRGEMYEFLQGRQVTPAAAKKLLEYYQPIYDEIHSDDDQVKEAFGKNLKTERIFMQGVVDDLNRYIGNKKIVKVRKPRAKKVKSVIDLVKSLQYQKEYPALKIVSVNPAEIIGANQLWTFNTKTRKLSQIVSMSPTGLGVKGTSITGLDTELSVSKSIRPNLQAQLIQNLLSSGKVALRNFMSNIKTSSTCASPRMNESTVILRVIK
jgi:hypothetical protein